MRTACMQFTPRLGHADDINRAGAVVCRGQTVNLHLIVLPELAVPGCDFKSSPGSETSIDNVDDDIASTWARKIALKYNCVVAVGYRNGLDASETYSSRPNHNLAIVINGRGQTVANYRNSFLFHTDELWNQEGEGGFFDGHVPGLGNISMGICMDSDPCNLQAPSQAFEVPYHILDLSSNLFIVSMACIERDDRRRLYSRLPDEPDTKTLSYWATRLEPIFRPNTQDEIVFVFCNRALREDKGTSSNPPTVIGIHNCEVNIYTPVVPAPSIPLLPPSPVPSPTPQAVRPRLIIPESPPFRDPSLPNSAVSMLSLNSEKSFHSVFSDDSMTSVSTVRSNNTRPPKESTPYPDTPLSGYPYHLFGERGGYHAHYAMSPLDGFGGMSPLSAASVRRFWRQPDSTPHTPNTVCSAVTAVAPTEMLAGWSSRTPMERGSWWFPWPAVANDAETPDTHAAAPEDEIEAPQPVLQPLRSHPSLDFIEGTYELTSKPSVTSRHVQSMAQNHDGESCMHPRPPSSKSRKTSRTTSTRKHNPSEATLQYMDRLGTSKARLVSHARSSSAPGPSHSRYPDRIAKSNRRGQSRNRQAKADPSLSSRRHGRTPARSSSVIRAANPSVHGQSKSRLATGNKPSQPRTHARSISRGRTRTPKVAPTNGVFDMALLECLQRM